MRTYILIMSLLIGVFAVMSLLYPLFIVAIQSVKGDGDVLTFAVYQKVLSGKYYMRALRETLIFCVATSALATLWALPLAWRMGRNLKGAALLRSVSQINFAFAGILYGMLIIALMGNAGALVIAERAVFGTEMTSGLAYTTFGLAITYLSFQIPRSALILSEAIAKLDGNLISAARTLGGRGPDTALLVVLPLIRPAILEAASFSFILAMGSFGPALLIARTVTIFPAVAYREFTGFLNFSVAAAMAMVLATLVLGVNFAMRRLADKHIAALRIGPDPRRPS
jgi:putative spermidine/putrescine transport system permease protein